MLTKKKDRLGIVVSDINFFFSHRIELAKKLSKTFEIYVFTDTTAVSNSVLNEYKFIRFVQIKTRINSNIFIKTLSLIRYVISLKSLLVSKQIDKTLYVTLESSLIGAVISKFLGNKNFFVISGAYVLRKSKKMRVIARKVFSISKSNKNRFILQNKEDKTFFEKILGKQNYLNVIKGNGINLNSIKYDLMPKTNKIKFLFASDLFYTKGVDDFYNAALKIKNTNFNAEFFIAGKYKKGHPLSIKESLYKNIINSSEIEYLGAWDQKTFIEKLSDYHVFVFPSFGEGIPLAVLEAMARGRALICSDVPGCNECLQEGINGYKCNVSSSESIIRAIERLIEDRDKIPKMGSNSRKIIEDEFDLNIIYKKYLNVLEQ